MSSRETPGISRREEHARETHEALLAAARSIFAAKGYGATSLEDIVARTRLTKGAFYHHFDSKAALLEAVYTDMERELLAEVTRAATAATGEAWDRLVVALDAFLEASAAPAYVQIVLRDAPSVLGVREARAIDHALGLGLLEELVGQLYRGRPPPVDLTAAARVLLAAASEVAVSTAYAEDPARARVEGRAVVLAMMKGLRAAR